jgi:hypothetical protein
LSAWLDASHRIPVEFDSVPHDVQVDFRVLFSRFPSILKAW